ncbi:4a-hydroxytetrahydrobiopterin dehydratase [Paenibacillus sp. IB182496]|uniref:Putative pterin-4-alpha-carbinolamine dehydratase n=1 Tax=Paenibacillus sabuli TaxID=2772509 RepID=A0A927BRL3_9BACL|nr:4a-hydroxytetrahydrobiopterin dehydratase [Paenibacillus sabuli]MBD2845486.1 4a-hydroxytetrahydrobiopterin dehydratase [Paenibacillus sabuli]
MTDILSQAELEHALQTLEGWSSGPEQTIEKTYTLGSFPEAIARVAQAAEAAEEMQHHPRIVIDYKRVTLSLTTHDAGGVTQKDVDGARRLEAIFT